MLRRLGVVVLAGLVCAGAAEAKGKNGRQHATAIKAVQMLSWAVAADRKCQCLKGDRHRKLKMIVARAEHELGQKMSRAAAYAVVRQGAMMGARAECNEDTVSEVEDTADTADEALDTVESDTAPDTGGDTGDETADTGDAGDIGDAGDTGDDTVDSGGTGDDTVDNDDTGGTGDTGDDTADTGDDTADTGDDTADTGDDTTDTGDDTADTGDDTADTGDDTADTGDTDAGGYTKRVRIYYLESRCRFLPRGRALGFWKAITSEHHRAVKRYGSRKVKGAMASAKASARRMKCNGRSRAAIIAVVKKMKVGG